MTVLPFFIGSFKYYTQEVLEELQYFRLTTLNGIFDLLIYPINKFLVCHMHIQKTLKYFRDGGQKTQLWITL